MDEQQSKSGYSDEDYAKHEQDKPPKQQQHSGSPPSRPSSATKTDAENDSVQEQQHAFSSFSAELGAPSPLSPGELVAEPSDESTEHEHHDLSQSRPDVPLRSPPVTPCKTPTSDEAAEFFPSDSSEIIATATSSSCFGPKVMFSTENPPLEENEPNVLRHRRSHSFGEISSSTSSAAALHAVTTTTQAAAANIPTAVAETTTSTQQSELIWHPQDEFSFNVPPPLESNQCTSAVQQASQQHMPTIFVNREEVLREESKFSSSSSSTAAAATNSVPGITSMQTSADVAGDTQSQSSSTSTEQELHAKIHPPNPTVVLKKKAPVSILYFLLRDILVNFWTISDDDADEQCESQQSMDEKCKRVYAFMLIPNHLERFLLLAACQCFDAFLFIFTFFPLRLLITLVYLSLYPFRILRRLISMHQMTAAQRARQPRRRPWPRPLKPGHVSILLKAAIIVCTLLALNQIDLSFVYHVIKRQSTVKLYMLFNMFEVADRLLSSFGQDILDSLFLAAAVSTSARQREEEADLNYQRRRSSTASSEISPPPKRYFSTAGSFLIATCGTFLHSLLIILQFTVLNVAFNSEGQSLLIILIANNFVEIKSNVFKKYNRVNLYHIACHDARERFHALLLLVFMVFRNMKEARWEWTHLSELLPGMAALFVTEILIDWMKHAFISKFNFIPADVYSSYMVSIAYDMLKWRRDGNTAGLLSDQSDAVATKLGFIAVPTCCVMIRVLQQSLSFGSYGNDLYAVFMGNSISTLSQFIMLGCMCFMLLFALKCLMSVVLLGVSLRIMERYVTSASNQEAAARNGGTDERSTVQHNEKLQATREGQADDGGAAAAAAKRYKRRHSFHVVVRTPSERDVKKFQRDDDVDDINDRYDSPAAGLLQRRRHHHRSGNSQDDELDGEGVRSLPSSPAQLTRSKLLSLRIGSLNPLPSSFLRPRRWNSLRQLRDREDGGDNDITANNNSNNIKIVAAGAKAVSYDFVNA